jgi:hypothetical protein
MIVAVAPRFPSTPSFPPPQHSPIFGHLASSQTVCKPSPRKSFLIWEYEEPVGIFAFRCDGSRGLPAKALTRKFDRNGVERNSRLHIPHRHPRPLRNLIPPNKIIKRRPRIEFPCKCRARGGPARGGCCCCRRRGGKGTYMRTGEWCQCTGVHCSCVSLYEATTPPSPTCCKPEIPRFAQRRQRGSKSRSQIGTDDRTRTRDFQFTDLQLVAWREYPFYRYR